MVFCGNLPGDIRTREVEDLFYKFGRVIEVKSLALLPEAFYDIFQLHTAGLRLVLRGDCSMLRLQTCTNQAPRASLVDLRNIVKAQALYCYVLRFQNCIHSALGASLAEMQNRVQGPASSM